MNESTLEFTESAILGQAIRVDTSSVWATVVDHERLTRVSVGSLMAFQGSTSSEFLVGVLDRVTRSQLEPESPDDSDDDNNNNDDENQLGVREIVEAQQKDLIRVVLLGTYRTVDGIRSNTFKRGADSYPLIDSACWVIDGTNLQKFMGLLTQQLEPAKRLQLGRFVADPTAIAVADGDRLFQRHAALLGSTGSGKSWSVALILERAHALSYANLIVLDMHGEYKPLTDGSEPIARYFRVAGAGDDGKVKSNVLFLPWWLLNQEEMQALLLDRTEENAPNQASRLNHHVRQLKLDQLLLHGRTEVASRFTADSPVPYSLSRLLELLEEDDQEMVTGSNGREKQGPFYGRLTRFTNRLRNKIEDRRYGFMFSQSIDDVGYEWLHGLAKSLLGTERGIKVIDFSEVPSDILPVVVGVLARILYEVHFWTEDEKRTPLTLVCDEAHLYLPADGAGSSELRALDVFERIAKEGRKYGISLMVVSQRPADVSKTILSQCNNFIALRLTNEQDQSVVKRLMPDSMDGLTSALPLLDVGEALLLGDAIILPTRIKLDPPRIKPASATKNFWTEWSERCVLEEDLVAAVEAMRVQSRRP